MAQPEKLQSPKIEIQILYLGISIDFNTSFSFEKLSNDIMKIYLWDKSRISISELIIGPH